MRSYRRWNQNDAHTKLHNMCHCKFIFISSQSLNGGEGGGFDFLILPSKSNVLKRLHCCGRNWLKIFRKTRLDAKLIVNRGIERGTRLSLNWSLSQSPCDNSRQINGAQLIQNLWMMSDWINHFPTESFGSVHFENVNSNLNSKHIQLRSAIPFT